MTVGTDTHAGSQDEDEKDNKKRRIKTLLVFRWKQQGSQDRRHSFGLAGLDIYSLLAVGTDTS